MQKEAVMQHLYLGRSPPLLTDMRVLRQSTGDDHLVYLQNLGFGDILLFNISRRSRTYSGVYAGAGTWHEFPGSG